ncbi:hypothetical protein CCH79_00018516, partial [Gambusia affinis]
MRESEASPFSMDAIWIEEHNLLIGRLSSHLKAMNPEKELQSHLFFYFGSRIFTGETPPAVHETEEDDNFTLGWDNLTQTNTTLTRMICFLLLSPPKVLYQKINGAEVPASQDGQFSGRVQSDGREGRLRLHLSRLRTEDSGSYRCDLVAYNQVLKKWEPQTSGNSAGFTLCLQLVKPDLCCSSWIKLFSPTVTFVLNVTKTSHGDKSASLNTPKLPLSPAPGGSAVSMATTIIPWGEIRSASFTNGQVTPAEETFTEFKDCNVKSDEEMNDQHKLLDSARTPAIILRRIDIRHCCVCKDDRIFNDLSDQDGNSTLKQEGPEPLQTEQEQEEPEHQQSEKEKQLCISQDEEQLVLKQETDDIL